MRRMPVPAVPIRVARRSVDRDHQNVDVAEMENSYQSRPVVVL